MSSRQIRLSTPDQLKTRLKDFLGRKINIVLNNRTVFFGELKSADESALRYANVRGEPFVLALAEVSEVYVDQKEPC